MLSILAGAWRVVDTWTRRRVVVSALLSLLMAGLEMAAFALLFLLIRTLTGDDTAADRYPALQRALGGPADGQLAQRLALAAVALLLLKSAVATCVALWQAGVQSQTEARLANRLYGEYMRQDYLAHLARNSAELIRNLTNSVGVVAGGVLGALITVVTEGTVLLGLFLTLLAVDAFAALSVAAYLAVLVVGYQLVITPVIHRAGIRDNELSQQTLQSLQEGFAGIKTVHAFDVIDRVSARYQRERTELARTRRTTIFVVRLPQYYLDVGLVVGIAGGSLLLMQTRSEQQAYALLGLLLAAALRVLPSVNRVLVNLNSIRNGGPSVQNLTRIDIAPPRRQTSTEATELPTPTGDVAFRDVHFTYPAATTPALRSVDLVIGAGSSVGVVGASGSGKTTLVDLLLGLLQPTSGEVLIDGVPLRGALVSAWRRQVGYVPQDTYLRDASILDNVVFSREVGSDVEQLVWQALDAAQMQAFVQGLPQGLHTRVGERGAKLSGGQRQRLGIARALLLRPQVLVLDEATSALDGETEAAIVETISQLRGRMTVLVVAHRLSTVQACDRILLVQEGMLADEGTFHELAGRNASFAAMVRRASVTGVADSVLDGRGDRSTWARDDDELHR